MDNNYTQLQYMSSDFQQDSMQTPMNNYVPTGNENAPPTNYNPNPAYPYNPNVTPPNYTPYAPNNYQVNVNTYQPYSTPPVVVQSSPQSDSKECGRKTCLVFAILMFVFLIVEITLYITVVRFFIIPIFFDEILVFICAILLICIYRRANISGLSVLIFTGVVWFVGCVSRGLSMGFTSDRNLNIMLTILLPLMMLRTFIVLFSIGGIALSQFNLRSKHQ